MHWETSVLPAMTAAGDEPGTPNVTSGISDAGAQASVVEDAGRAGRLDRDVRDPLPCGSYAEQHKKLLRG